MAFTPPFFSKFGKKSKDLLSKKYEFTHNFKHSAKADNGVSLETTSKAKKEGGFDGKLKLNYAHKQAEFEGSLATGGKITAQVKSSKLADGLTVTVSANEKPSGKVAVEWKQDQFVAESTVNHDSKATVVDSGVAFGFDGISVGLGGKLDIKSNQFSKLNVGLEYAQKDFTVTAKALDFAKSLETSYFFKASGALSVGGKVAYPLDNKDGDSPTTLAFGTDYALDKDTTIKAKALSDGAFSASVEHRLASPKLTLGLAAEFDGASKSFEAKKFGISLSL